MNWKKMAALVLGLLLSLGVLAGCAGEPAMAEDSPFASFTADTLDGGTFTQDGIREKDVTVINFWGTFCPPCLAEMPDLAAYAKALPDNVQLITVCLDVANEETANSARAILDSAGFECVTLIPGDDPNFLSLCQSIQAVPTTIFVDSKGNIAGNPIIGGQADLEMMTENYTGKVNEVLTASGKAEISFAD